VLEKVLENSQNEEKRKAPATNETVDIQGLCSGSPSWTRTNDPFGQKHSRLSRFASKFSLFLPAQTSPSSATGGGES
jgi:hypothetical protein